MPLRAEPVRLHHIDAPKHPTDMDAHTAALIAFLAIAAGAAARIADRRVAGLAVTRDSPRPAGGNGPA
jgi:hypothetical protein